MKKVIKAFAIIVFSILYCTGCNLIKDITSLNSSQTNSSSSGNKTVCSYVTPSSASGSNNGATTRLSKRARSSVYESASKSTMMIAACYVVDKNDYEYITSGFVFDKEEETNSKGEYTYYVMSNASGIFYRYIKSIGSTGFDVSSDTAVVRNGEFELVFQDGHRYLAEMSGYYDNFDVVIFKFQTEDVIPVLSFADSDELEVGDPVTAIGTPVFGSALINSYVSGYISGLNRTETVTYTGTYGGKTYAGKQCEYPVFQFDAPTNGGMEGGPVLNSEGKVIGMMSYKFGIEDNYESLSTAIASNNIQNIANSIIKTGSYTLPLIGISITDVVNASAFTGGSWVNEQKYYQGLYIVKEQVIDLTSPAGKAGMKNDIVLTKIIINDVEYDILNAAVLKSKLATLVSTDTVKLVTFDSSKVSTTYTINLWS